MRSLMGEGRPRRLLLTAAYRLGAGFLVLTGVVICLTVLDDGGGALNGFGTDVTEGVAFGFVALVVGGCQIVAGILAWRGGRPALGAASALAVLVGSLIAAVTILTASSPDETTVGALTAMAYFAAAATLAAGLGLPRSPQPAALGPPPP
jgi:hypothetical protein